jgi:hypothetical protein
VNCIDSDIADQHQPAVGTCHHCGCGVCGDHAVLISYRISYRLMRTEPIGRKVPVDPPARRLLCLTCAAAIDAANPQPAVRISRVRRQSSSR